MTTKIRHLVMDVGLAPDQSSVLLDMVYGWLDDVAATYGSRLGELPPTTQKALSTRQDVQATVTKLLNLAEDISAKEGNLKRAREATLSKVMAQADSKLSPEGLQAMRDDSERDQLTRTMTLAQQSLDDLIVSMAEDVAKDLGPAPCELKADELDRDLEALELAELEKLLGPHLSKAPQLRDGSVEALPETKPTELEATEPQQHPVPKKPTRTTPAGASPKEAHRVGGPRTPAEASPKEADRVGGPRTPAGASPSPKQADERVGGSQA